MALLTLELARPLVVKHVWLITTKRPACGATPPRTMVVPTEQTPVCTGCIEAQEGS